VKNRRTRLKFVAAILVFCWPLIASSKVASQSINEELLKNLTYRNIGPTRQGGRFVDYAVPKQKPYTFYAATASGGLKVPDSVIKNWIENSNPYAFSLFENFYMTNGCFLEEGQLFKDAEKISHIPTIIINGRYDVICPPVTAYRLHKLLPKSKLIIAEGAGHWMGEKPIERALIEAMREFE
jgi:pimeloyl-ACP methyl ester carboxylesterase